MKPNDRVPHDGTPFNTPYDTRALQRADAAHFLHPFTDFQSLAAKGARIITRGHGIHVWDSEGHRILDGMSGLWCMNVGYGRGELADAAAQQMRELAFYNSFFQTSVVPAIELAKLLVSITPPQFNHVFFTSSGSEGNDTVLRMVRRYWDLQGQPRRKVIIGRKNGYHGSTVAGASLGGMSYMHAQGDLPIPGIVHIEQPYHFALGRDLPADEFGLQAARWLEEKILEVGPDKVAAFIGEPIQGAGGVIIPPATYWPEVQRICDQYGVLLVSDEVICGFGRTGNWFGCETLGFKPDLMTFAKGVTSGYVPLGGVMVGDRVAKTLIEQGGEFEHGFTYSGHPVACAVAIENIHIIQREKLVQRVANETGPHLNRRFTELLDHPLVGVAETKGLMAGLVLVRNKQTLEGFDPKLEVGMVCRGYCFNGGVIMRAVGDRMIVAPPLVMTRDQIDEMIDLIRAALDQTYEDVKRRGWLD